MPDLYEFTIVHVPFERAADALESSLRRFGNGDSAHITLPLRVKVAELSVEHDVEAKVVRRRDESWYSMLDVTWEPKGGGPYPSFTGWLGVEDEGFGYSRLELNGTYRPPLGIVGAAFDAIAGHGIAVRSAQALLEHLKRELEAHDADSGAAHADRDAPGATPPADTETSS